MIAMGFNLPALVARGINPILDTQDSVQKSPELEDATMDTKGQATSVTKHVTEGVNDSTNRLPDKEAQQGVQQAEAVTLVWSGKSLILAYAFILLVCFVNSLEQQVMTSLAPYVTSNFSLHSFVSTISVVSNVLGGIIQLPVAKILDTWGRPEGFAAMTFLCTVGAILMAVSQSVHTFAAAQVFYVIGYTGISYVVQVVIADTSSLQNRALAIAFSQSPYMITAFAAPSISQAFLDTVGFRWAFGCFAILFPITSMPLWVILFYHQRKAKKQGLLVRIPSGRSLWKSIFHYLIEVDAVGVLAITTGLVLLLLPFSLIGIGANTRNSPGIITMLVLGAILILAFGLWERFLAPKTFLAYHLLISGNTLGAIILITTIFAGFYCWDNYFNSYLQVVNGLSISQAGYVANIYNAGSAFFVIIIGLLIRSTGRFKWLAWIALLVQVLGGGLMIHFRHPNTNVGYVCMCQVLISFGGGALYICGEVAAMSLAKHGDIAALLALLGLSFSIGSAIGSSVSGGIWAHTLPEQLAVWLPDYAQANLTDIYGGLDVQLSYPLGNPVRDAIIRAYGVTQRRMCIAGTAFFAIGFIAVAMWKNVNVKNIRQIKGTIF